MVIPAEFISILSKDKQAETEFAKMSPSHKREYVEWIMEAKKEATRLSRAEKMYNMLIEQKSKNWKYQK